MFITCIINNFAIFTKFEFEIFENIMEMSFNLVLSVHCTFCLDIM